MSGPRAAPPTGRFAPLLTGAALLLLILLAAQRLTGAFLRLLAGTGAAHGPGDLVCHYEAVQHWFAGNQVFNLLPVALFPASFSLLWPFMGWLSIGAARVLWAVTSGVCLLGVCWFTARAVGARSPLERLGYSLVPLVIYATSITIGLGQLGLHVLFSLLASLVWGLRTHASWKRDLAMAGLFLAALVKPSLAAPFFWIVLLVCPRRRPALLVLIGYGLLTGAALAFQSTPDVMQAAFENAAAGTIVGGEEVEILNLSSLLARLPGGYQALAGWSAAASVLVLALFGIWVWRNRRRPLWTLLGVTGLFARVWTYHRLYDDLLLLLPLIALVRLARQARGSRLGRWAGLLAAATFLSSLGPVSFLQMRSPLPQLFTALLAAVWLADTVFLIRAPEPVCQGLLLTPTPLSD